MNLQQLVYFVAVADEGSFTRAATTVHVAQPGVSAQVRRLEGELGHDLFDRAGRQVRLTDAGAAVLPYARAALAAVAGVRQAADDLTGLLRGQVAVGVVVGGPAVALAVLIADFHAAHPGVEFSVAEGGSDDLVEQLRSRVIDLALIGVSGPAPEGIDVRSIATEPLVAAVDQHHRLAGQVEIRLSALAGHTLIALPAGTGMRDSLDAAARRDGIELRVAIEASDPSVIMELASRGLGVAVVSASIAALRADVLHIVSIGPTITSDLALAWRAGGPPGAAARALVELARAQLLGENRAIGAAVKKRSGDATSR